MTEQEIKEHIARSYPSENESVEWKNYSNLKNTLCGHEGDDVVSYVWAIANMNGGSLVIGVEDRTLNIVGIREFGQYNKDSAKFRISEKCLNLPADNLEVVELKSTDTNKTVWIINIPKHIPKLPVYAHNQAWQRIGDSLVKMTDSRLQAILGEIDIAEDWSIKTIDDASIDDFDEEAIEKARKEYAKRAPQRQAEIQAWDVETFLNKAKLTIKGTITRAALILLGKNESEFLLNPYVAKIRWSLRTVGAVENKDYEILGMPLILSVDKLYNKIRNVKYLLVRPESLFPDEMLRYDMFNIREPLNNAIAHQDYTKCARIEVVEYEDDHLIFQNYGTFLPGSVEEVVMADCPQSVYRNRFLVEAMRNLNMIETEGGGIKKMFKNQSIRFFPMPDYDFSDGKVRVEITGKVIDEKFANLLTQNKDLSLLDIMMLDKVQKRKELTNEEIAYLRKNQLIEGRKPNFFLSESVVKPINSDKLKAEYLKNKVFEDDFYKKQIIRYLKTYENATKKELSSLFTDKLSQAIDEKQKRNKLQNLLTSLRKEGKIEYIDKHWQLKRS